MSNQDLDYEWIELIQQALQQGLDIEDIKSFFENYSNNK
ncbi:MAG TPA: anti-repressor SinI family protein [Metabacillus sp.]|nr:anti-repressor SinI family protein [Metabacillus sp.]